MRQRIRGLVVGGLVGLALGVFVFVGLHATVLAAALIGGIVGISVLAVVASAASPEDAAADAAWQAAAPDLPPVSDRVALEGAAANLPPPGEPTRPRRRSPRPVVAGIAGVFGRPTRSSATAAGATMDEAAAGPGGTASPSADVSSGQGLERS